MNPIISIVIPFYNAESHLQKNVEQIIQSTNLTIEIILVNDGSQDNGQAIAKKLSEAYPFIKVLSLEENSGAGVARNAAIELCQGEYTLFFDSDDHLYNKALDRLYTLATQSKPDLILTSYDVSLDHSPNNLFMPSWDQKIFHKLLGQNSSKTLSENDKKLAIQTLNYPWNKLFKTVSLKSNNIRFGSTKVQNDILGHWLGITKLSNVLITEEKIGIHYTVSGSGSITSISDLRRLQALDALKELYGYLKMDTRLWDIYNWSYAIFFIRLVYWAELRIDSSHKKNFINLTKFQIDEQGLIKFYSFSNCFKLGFKNYIYSIKFLHQNQIASLLYLVINLIKYFKSKT